MSYDMLASVWPKYLNLVHQTVSRACRYGLGTRLVACMREVAVRVYKLQLCNNNEVFQRLIFHEHLFQVALC